MCNKQTTRTYKSIMMTIFMMKNDNDLRMTIMTMLVAMLQDLLELHNFDTQKTQIMFPAPPGLEILLPGST